MLRRALLLMTVLLVGCRAPDLVGQDLADLPPITGDELQAMVSASGRPSVVNVWASWCAPCRSEAPLLSAAHTRFGATVDFIGIDVEDNQPGAKDFITRYGVHFDHFFDPDRLVPEHYGAFGTPITFFFDSSGVLIDMHLGVIDERTLALGIDEITGP